MTTLASAVLAGVAVLLGGNLPWIAFLAPLNLRFFQVVPWAIVPMAIYLVLYWRYIAGQTGSKSSAHLRRADLRANTLTADAWSLAIFTGLIGLMGLLVLAALMARLVALPQADPLVPPVGMPAITIVMLLVMSSIVAGVTEEAGFRGYMQGRIERRYGVAVAILVNGAMFGLLHFPNHPDAAMVMLPYYIAVAAVYGGLTWAADSILPALVLHVGGDVWSLTRLWLTGRPEWQLSTSPVLVRETGVDASFVAAAVAVAALGSAFLVLCRSLRRFTLTTKSGGDVANYARAHAPHDP